MSAITFHPLGALGSSGPGKTFCTALPAASVAGTMAGLAPAYAARPQSGAEQVLITYLHADQFRIEAAGRDGSAVTATGTFDYIMEIATVWANNTAAGEI